MPSTGSAGPYFFGVLFPVPTSPDLAHVEWTYKISTENAPEEFQFGSEHLVCRTAERRCTTAERLAQKTIVIWEALVGFRGDGAHHLTRAAIRAPSRAFPRRRALCTNSKKPR